HYGTRESMASGLCSHRSSPVQGLFLTDAWSIHSKKELLLSGRFPLILPRPFPSFCRPMAPRLPFPGAVRLLPPFLIRQTPSPISNSLPAPCCWARFLALRAV